MFIYSGDRDAGKYESITVSSTAIGCTSTLVVPTSGEHTGMQCQGIFLTLETANVRFCYDGTTATTTVGHLLTAGQTLTLSSPRDVAKLSMYRDDSTDATAHVTYRY